MDNQLIQTNGIKNLLLNLFLKKNQIIFFECVDKINFEDMYFRKDIGQKGPMVVAQLLTWI